MTKKITASQKDKNKNSSTKTIKKETKTPKKNDKTIIVDDGECVGLMLAETIEKANQDPTGWLMSEKLDGVRSYWNGKTLFSRNGHKFFPPQWFKDALPTDLALDEELFTKRDDFQNAVGIVKKQKHDQASEEKWKEIKFMVFDAPLLKSKFEDRLVEIKTRLSKCDKKIVRDYI